MKFAQRNRFPHSIDSQPSYTARRLHTKKPLECDVQIDEVADKFFVAVSRCLMADPIFNGVSSMRGEQGPLRWSRPQCDEAQRAHALDRLVRSDCRQQPAVLFPTALAEIVYRRYGV